MRKKLFEVTLLILGLLQSCGWHTSASLDPEHQHTIAVPYVTGDGTGTLTSAIVEEISRQNGFRYVATGARLTLMVKMVDKASEDIGFRYDPKHFTKNKKKTIRRIIPSETRLKRLVEVTVVETATQKILLGPSYLLGTCDFDHEDYSPDHNINTFSLGQLTDIDTAYDVVDIPINRDIAKKVALFLKNNFDVLS